MNQEVERSTVDDRLWMQYALDLARRAESDGEVPIGAVVVKNGELLGEGWNRSIQLNDPSAHAEIMAMRDAGKKLNNYRLRDCTLYVTLEPCAMCVGAIIHARIKRVVFAAVDPKTGAVGGCFELLRHPSHNHQPAVDSGCCGAESSDLLRNFFRDKRSRNN